MTSACYCTVLRAATRRIAAHYDAALAPFGINIAQFSLLRTVARRGPLALTELGRLVELDRSTIGRNVRVMERMKLLSLGRGKDQREALVSLTDEGRKVLTDGDAPWHAVQKQLEERLGTAGAQELHTLLGAL